jgi:hypothetical protein
LQTESQSVDLGDEESVSVEINLGAGNLEVTGGAEQLLEADFSYNVAKLKPEMEYTNGTLIVRQPEANGTPSLINILDFRNEWDLQLNDDVPMDLKVDAGAGSGDLQLAGLPLTGLDITLGAGIYTVDLSGDWAGDLDVTIDTGASHLSVVLPKDVGVRVKLDPGANMIDTTGLTKDGDIYTNAAYGVAEVSMRIDLVAGIGQVNLDVEK